MAIRFHLFAFVALMLASHAIGADWAQFRGGSQMSHAGASSAPVSWAKGTTPAWRTEIPGSGWSQPIVAQGKIFLTTAISKTPDKPKGMMGGVMDPSTMGKPAMPKDPIQFAVICIDPKSGSIVWQKVVAEAIPTTGKHASNTYATETPCASSDTLYAYFGAIGRVAAMDFEGNIKWTQDFGPQPTNNQFGTGASLVLFDDALVVQRYNEQEGKLLCLNTSDGSTRWTAERSPGTSWATPIVWSNQGQQQVVAAGQGMVLGYDLKSGEEQWRLGGLDTSFSCSLVADESGVYIGTSSPGSSAPICAVRSGQKGDLTLPKGAKSSESVLWAKTKSGAGMPSPVLVQGLLYYFGNTITCYDAKTGEEKFRKRMPGGTLAAGCPLVIGDQILVVNERGTVVTLRSGSEYVDPQESEIAAEGEFFWATPAAMDQALLVRSSAALYCFGTP
jgi:outer membrane protein assembly factor BamB